MVMPTHLSAVHLLFASYLLRSVSCESSGALPLSSSPALSPSLLPTRVDFSFDEVLWDALVEAALVLSVFAATSMLLAAFRQKRGRAKPAQKNVKTDKSWGSASSDRCQAPSQARLAKCIASTFDAEGKPKDMDGAVVGTDVSTNHTSAASDKQNLKLVTASTYCTDLLAAAVRKGKAAHLPRLLDQTVMRARAEANSNAESHEALAAQHLLSALRACAASRCFREAIAAYDHMAGRIGTGSSAIWSLALYSAAEIGDYQRCQDMFRRLCESGQVSGHDIVNTVRCCAYQRDTVGLKRMLRDLHSASQEIDTFTWNRSLAVCANADGGLQLAEILAADHVCNDALDAVGYNTLMKCNARNGHFARCIELRSEMVAKGIQPSEVTFGILLDACVGAKEIDKARQIFDDLCKSGLRLNAVHCTTFIKGLVGAGRYDEAAAVLQEMLQTPDAKPDLITYSTLVKAYSDSGNPTGALRVLKQMLAQNITPDEIAFNSVLNGCCAQSHSHRPAAEVLHFFEILIELGMRPTTTTMSILLKALTPCEAFKQAIDILEDAPARFGMEPDMRLFSQLVQACIKARRGGKALEGFRAMLKVAKRRGEDIHEAFGRLLRHCGACAQFDTASRLCNAARQAGMEADPELLNGLRDAASRKGKVMRPF